MYQEAYQAFSTIEFCNALDSALKQVNFKYQGTIDYYSIKIQRFRLAGKRGGKDLFIVIYPGIGATFGDWHDRGSWQNWFFKSNNLISPSIRKEYEAQRAELKRIAELRRSQANYRAQRFWYNAIVNDDALTHPYIVKKQIRPIYAKAIKSKRNIKDLLLIPVRNVYYELQTIQLIKANGFKRLYKGTTATDNMIWLSGNLAADYSGVIRICEGYATGVSIFMTIGDPVVCAINAHNLKNVAVLLRKRFPQAILKICADNDKWGDKNIGLTYALEADIAANAVIYFPDFSKFSTVTKPTDFNDLLVLAGMEEIKRQLIQIKKRS